MAFTRFEVNKHKKREWSDINGRFGTFEDVESSGLLRSWLFPTAMMPQFEDCYWPLCPPFEWLIRKLVESLLDGDTCNDLRDVRDHNDHQRERVDLVSKCKHLLEIQMIIDRHTTSLCGSLPFIDHAAQTRMDDIIETESETESELVDMESWKSQLQATEEVIQWLRQGLGSFEKVAMLLRIVSNKWPNGWKFCTIEVHRN